MVERELIRYAAYFKGWCQAFGEHQGMRCTESGIDWLLADHQLGLVLPSDMVKSLHREVLLRRRTGSRKRWTRSRKSSPAPRPCICT
jgi:hypothetical protein